MRRLEVLPDDFFPAYVVWELTLRCDQPCAHCGSRAGAKRPEELTTQEALRVVDQLAAMRAKDVVLIGGEAYLHDGFLAIARALKDKGIRPLMTTGGRGIDDALARAMKDAGVYSVSVSIDGLREEHDTIRKAAGSFDAALRALRALKAAGLLVSANTHVNRVNQHVLEDLFALLAGEGISSWQVQITVPLGRAADRPQMLLQPYDLVDVVPRVAALKRAAMARGILVMPGNNLGYFGKDEALLRSVKRDEADHWQGCQAGKRVMGIESDGGVKGCPSLQSVYVGGNVKERSLDDLWNGSDQLAFARKRSVDDLHGFCRSCPFSEPCLAGCSFTAHALFGRTGNNPYCHFRAEHFKKQGLRERLVPTKPAEGKPFDHGLFDLVVEPWGAPEPAVVEKAQLVAITRRAVPR
jgi:radical SAM protein with 4Fe4S-binding SPASM domain